MHVLPLIKSMTHPNPASNAKAMSSCPCSVLLLSSPTLHLNAKSWLLHSSAALLGYVPTLHNPSSKMLQVLAWMLCLASHSHCTQVAVGCLCCLIFGGSLASSQSFISIFCLFTCLQKNNLSSQVRDRRWQQRATQLLSHTGSPLPSCCLGQFIHYCLFSLAHWTHHSNLKALCSPCQIVSHVNQNCL